MIRPLALLLLTAVAACASPRPLAPPASAAAEVRAPVTILISIDGFRPDYLDRGVMPVLSGLAAGGVRAAMRPSFPTKTAPNHWTLVTGLRPDRNGIVANNMEDPRRPGEVFTMGSDDPFWWGESEPIWVTAERAGIPTATMFWPGSVAAIGGVRSRDWPNATTGGTRPSAWQAYYMHLPERSRVDALIDWLRRPLPRRPRFLTLYLDSVDTAGHIHGPDAAGTTRAAAEADRTIGHLVDELAALGQPANLVIVSDHGMRAVSRRRLVAFDRLLPPAAYKLLDDGAFASVSPMAGQEALVARVLTRPHPHMRCWRRGQVPADYAYGRNPRVAPVVCVAAPGWQLRRTPEDAKREGGGDHGFDPADPQMQALFVAHGPAFRPGVTLPPFDNAAVAPLLRDLLGLPPGNRLDGTSAPFASARR